MAQVAPSRPETTQDRERDATLGLALVWAGLMASALNLAQLTGRLSPAPFAVRTLLVIAAWWLARYSIRARSTAAGSASRDGPPQAESTDKKGLDVPDIVMEEQRSAVGGG